MTVEELQNKHEEIIGESDLGVIEEFKDSVIYDEEAFGVSQRATKLSIEFAINVLEWTMEYAKRGWDKSCQDNVEDKIQELKQYLNK